MIPLGRTAPRCEAHRDSARRTRSRAGRRFVRVAVVSARTHRFDRPRGRRSTSIWPREPSTSSSRRRCRPKLCLDERPHTLTCPVASSWLAERPHCRRSSDGTRTPDDLHLGIRLRSSEGLTFGARIVVQTRQSALVNRERRDGSLQPSNFLDNPATSPTCSPPLPAAVSANSWPTSPASKKPSCSTPPETKADRARNASSPALTPPRRAYSSSSNSTPSPHR